MSHPRLARIVVVALAAAMLVPFLPVSTVYATEVAPETRSETVAFLPSQAADAAHHAIEGTNRGVGQGRGENPDRNDSEPGPTDGVEGSQDDDASDSGSSEGPDVPSPEGLDGEVEVEAGPDDAIIAAPMPFSGVGLAGATDTEPELRWRAKTTDGTWTDWDLVPVLDEYDGPDPDTDEATVAAQRQARGWRSDAIWVGAATHLELEVVEGDPGAMEITFIDTAGLSEGRVERALRSFRSLSTTAPAEASTSRPRIISRAEWGASTACESGTITTTTPHFSVIHHTVTINNYTQEQAAQQVRNIYHWHTACHGSGMGWADIGYNFVIDRFGNIYEGRRGGVDRGVIGAHAYGYNTGSIGIALMGEYNSVAPSTAAVRSLDALLAWKFAHHSIPVDLASRTIANGNSIPRLVGHRNVRGAYQANPSTTTDCPGQLMNDRMPGVRDRLASSQEAPVGPRSPMMGLGVVSVPLVGDWVGDGRVSAGWRVGDRFYLEGGGAGGSDVVVRFGRASDVPFVGDWNGDGRTTVGVRRGDRWLLRNANTEGPADHDFVFGRASDAVGVVGDWNGDGRTSVGFWRPGGFWSLRNDLSAGMGDERFTFGMAEDARPVVGDWNGDGRTTVGFWRPGGFWSLRNHHSAGWGDYRFTFGRAEDARPVVGDWNGDGRVTVGAVSGDEWLLRDRHAAGSRDGTWWFGAGPSTALMGDWNADGRQTPGWKIGQFFHLVAGGADGSDVSVRYGLQRGDVGVAGDWNGDGRTTIGVRRGDEWLLRNSNTAGYADHVFRFGRASDAVGVVGDWNGDGRDSVGFWRPGGFWSLRNDLSAGMGDYRFTFGRAEDARPVVGDWNADGRTTVGFRRPGGYWSLRNRHGAGTGDHRFSFGLQPQDEGFVGDWNGDGRTSVGVRRDNRWLLRDPHTAGTATYTHHFNR
jgi:hypothetical protein